MQKIILFAVGSFNPITVMHLRMFELARDYLRKTGRVSVLGGILSPVNDRYPKQGLATAHHRTQMTQFGASTSDHQWIKVSPWEAMETTEWTRTCNSLKHHQAQINRYLEGSSPTPQSWMPDSDILGKAGNTSAQTVVKLTLLCGADVLESFNIPNLWSNEHMETIAKDFGIVVITRSGQDPEASIERNSILKTYKHNIFIVEEKIRNDISSTKIREAISIGDSIKYLVPDPVISYIADHQLYR